MSRMFVHFGKFLIASRYFGNGLTKVEVIRYSLYSLLAICATTIANDQCATATDSLLAIYATMNIWLVAYQSLTDTLHIYILTFTLQFFPSMERNLSKDAKHRLGLNNETRYSPILSSLFS